MLELCTENDGSSVLVTLSTVLAAKLSFPEQQMSLGFVRCGLLLAG